MFKKPALLGIAFTLALAAISLTVQPVPASNIKDIYFEQANNQSQQTNTGLAYWIELSRAGRRQKVDSRFQFRSGDLIRLHVKANMNGYIHVILSKGSSGKQTILFPIKGLDSSSLITANKEYLIPRTFMHFDNVPGTEHLKIALSRQNIPSSQLFKPSRSDQIATVSIHNDELESAQTENEEVLVAFNDEENTSAGETLKAISSNQEAFSKDLDRIIPVRHAPPSKKTGARRRRPPSTTSITTPPPYTYVVLNNVQQALVADLALNHAR